MEDIVENVLLAGALCVVSRVGWIKYKKVTMTEVERAKMEWVNAQEKFKDLEKRTESNMYTKYWEQKLQDLASGKPTKDLAEVERKIMQYKCEHLETLIERQEWTKGWEEKHAKLLAKKQ
jgi:hypothetical protein